MWTRGRPAQRGLPDLQHPIDITPGCALGEFRLRTGFLQRWRLGSFEIQHGIARMVERYQRAIEEADPG